MKSNPTRIGNDTPEFWLLCRLILWHASDFPRGCVPFRVHSGLCKCESWFMVLSLKSTFGEEGSDRNPREKSTSRQVAAPGCFSRTAALTSTPFLRGSPLGESGSTGALLLSEEICPAAEWLSWAGLLYLLPILCPWIVPQSFMMHSGQVGISFPPLNHEKALQIQGHLPHLDIYILVLLLRPMFHY